MKLCICLGHRLLTRSRQPCVLLNHHATYYRSASATEVSVLKLLKAGIDLHLIQHVFEVVIWFLYRMAVHSLVGCHHNAFVHGQPLHLLLHVATLVRTSVVASATTSRQQLSLDDTINSVSYLIDLCSRFSSGMSCSRYQVR